MEQYPRLLANTLSEVISKLRTMIDLRDDDVEEVNAIKRTSGHETGFARATKSVSAAYSAGENDLYIDGTGGGGGITITLAASPKDGQTHKIAKADAGAGAVTISGNGKNINGSATLALAAQYNSATIVYIGGAGEWRVIT